MPLGLLVIARNDAAGIEKTLLSASDMVDTMTVVIDDKSTDETRAICERLGATTITHPMPEAMADARNVAIEVVRLGMDHLIMLDPGDTLEGEPPTKLLADVYDVWTHEGAMRYPRIHLFRAACGLRYEGQRNDEPIAPSDASRSIAPRLIYKRGRAPRAIETVDTLLARLTARPDDFHAMADLGQAYRDEGLVERARECFEKRIAMERVLQRGQADEPRYIAMLEVAFLVEKDDGSSIGDVMSAYLRAHEMRPLLAEPLFHLACFLRERDCLGAAWHFARRAAELPLPSQGIVTDIEVYEWKAKAEIAIEAWMLGDRATATRLLFEIAHGKPQYREWADEQLAAISSQDPPDKLSGWGPSRPLTTAERSK